MTIPLVVGLGSFHGDDQAGWLVIDSLWALGYPVRSARKATHPADLLDDLPAGRPLTVCDAVQHAHQRGMGQRVIHRSATGDQHDRAGRGTLEACPLPPPWVTSVGALRPGSCGGGTPSGRSAAPC